MIEAIHKTDFHFPHQENFYRGKVRDIYFFKNQLAMVATDRISAFDVVLPRAIPYKGQVLNQMAFNFLKATEDILPNWVITMPDPNVTLGKKCEPFDVEMVIRGYLAGHAWREYQAGKRVLCGETLPEGLKENDKLPHPIITPTTKAKEGHDEDISKADILAQGIVAEKDYLLLEQYTHQLFERGTTMAADQGLILVDTKYEFGRFGDQIVVIDEIHTPDSSRYFYAEGYAERQKNNQMQKQLSKEFVRQWLISEGFQGKEGQSIPIMDDAIVNSISERYIELYEKVTGQRFVKNDYKNALNRIQKNIKTFIA